MNRAFRLLCLVAAFGAWAAAWSALPHVLYLAAGPPLSSGMVGASDIAGQALRKALGIHAPSLALQMLGIAAVACGLALIWLGLLALLDRRGETARALRWSLGGAWLGLAWTAALCAIAPAAERWLSPVFAWPALLAMAAGASLLPAFCWRADLVRADALPRAWAPRWPGPAPAVLLMAGIVLCSALSLGLSWLGSQTPLLAALVESLYFIIVAALLAMLIPPWLQRADSRTALAAARTALRWPALRDLVALQLRIQGGCLLLLGPPLLAAAIDSWHLQPMAAQSLSAAGVATPGFLRTWQAAAQGVTEHWSLALNLGMGWLTALSAARLLRDKAPRTG